MADLKDFYPVTVQASPRSDGSPAAPGATASGSPSASGNGSMGDAHKSPGLWVLIFAGLGLFLLHKA
jgi:hypothetical protein